MPKAKGSSKPPRPGHHRSEVCRGSHSRLDGTPLDGFLKSWLSSAAGSHRFGFHTASSLLVSFRWPTEICPSPLAISISDFCLPPRHLVLARALSWVRPPPRGVENVS